MLKFIAERTLEMNLWKMGLKLKDNIVLVSDCFICIGTLKHLVNGRMKKFRFNSIISCAVDNLNCCLYLGTIDAMVHRLELNGNRQIIGEFKSLHCISIDSKSRILILNSMDGIVSWWDLSDLSKVYLLLFINSLLLLRKMES